MHWDSEKKQVRLEKPQEETKTFSCDSEPNCSYVAEIEHFFDRIERRDAANTGVTEAIDTLRVALGARLAATQKKWVTL